MKKWVLITAALGVAFIAGMQYFYRHQGLAHRHLLLAHNLAPDHPVHLGVEKFAELVKTGSQGRIDVTIYPSGQIGTEKEVLELVQLGAVSMTKVSSLSLESFTPLIGILNLPFLFRDRQHDFHVLDSSIGLELLATPAAQRLRGLTYYDAGERNFYGHKAILRPEDVAGLKIRVMESSTSIRMLQLLGGSPTPMPYGEVYTSLQQGVIDGAENNLAALTVNRHGEVAKHFSRDQHVFAPDILLISEPIWQGMSESDRELLRQSAEASKIYQRTIWEERIKEYEAEARDKMGIHFYDPDKTPFIKKVAPLHQEFESRGPEWSRLIRTIKGM